MGKQNAWSVLGCSSILLLSILVTAAPSQAPALKSKKTPDGLLSLRSHQLTLSSPGKAIRWTASFGLNELVDVGWTPLGIVSISQIGAEKTPSAVLSVSLLARDSGQVIWKHSVPGGLSTWTGSKMWNILGGTVMVFLQEGDFQTNVVGLRTSDGSVAWTVDGMTRSAYRDSRFILFRPFVMGNPLSAPGSLLLVSIDLTTNTKTSFNWTIAARPNCGALKEGDIDSGFSEVASPHYYFVVRADGCGAFTTRYDWHGTLAQVPVVINDVARR